LCGIAGNALVAIDSLVISWQDVQSLIIDTTASVETKAAAENEEGSRAGAGVFSPGVAAIAEGR
jgi:hypothetical protein